MKFIPEHPFDCYKSAYIVKNKEMRKMVCLVNSENDRTTVSLARYKMSVKLQRRLEKTEQVDHIDNDKTNDAIENLQLLTPSDNLQKHTSQRPNKILIDYKCPICFSFFTLKYHRSPASVKSKNTAYCSRSCGAKGAWLQPETKIIEMGRRNDV